MVAVRPAGPGLGTLVPPSPPGPIVNAHTDTDAALPAMLEAGATRDDLLDVLSRLGAAVGPDSLRTLTEPLLQLLGELTGLEAVYLTRIDWVEGAQVIEIARNVGDGFEVTEGTRVAWSDTLCELSLASGEAWNVDVPGTWGERAERLDLGIQSFVSVPVQTDPDAPPYGTLCGASPRRLEADQRVVDILELFAGMIGTALQRDAALAQARARADYAEERLAGRIRFAARVEHAMKNPLTVITGWVQTLQQDAIDQDMLHKGLDAIGRTTDRLTAQVGDLLVEARSAIGAGQVEAVDVRRVAEDCRELADGHPFTVRGDLRLQAEPVAVHVLLEHLVENAVTHTPDGTEIRVILLDDAIIVEDDGPGLPDRDDLFEPFVTTDRTGMGTGLGLHIIQTITQRLGGELEAGSSDSGGARFTITFR